MSKHATGHLVSSQINQVDKHTHTVNTSHISVYVSMMDEARDDITYYSITQSHVLLYHGTVTKLIVTLGNKSVS